jgi:hypothetical protein
MPEPNPSSSSAAKGLPPHAGPTQWPGFVGVLGIAVSAVLFVDKAEELLTPWLWPQEAWRQRFTPAMANLVAETIPPMQWTLPASFVGMLLAVLLFVGSVGVLRRRQSGVRLCRSWAWLAILWGSAEVIIASVLLQRLALDAPQLAPEGWAGAVALGIFVALAMILAFPLFLLLWFRRETIRRETAHWSR